MADNSTLPVAVGTEVFANDDISSVKYPRVKATWGPDGTANDTDVASGKPLPVQLRNSAGQLLSDTTGLLISTAQLGTMVTGDFTKATPTVPVENPTDQAVPIKVQAVANGTTSSRVNAAASTNATSLKASAGNVFQADLFNVAAYDVFFKFYNKAAAPLLVPLATPTNSAFSTSTTGGTLAAATYFYRVSATNTNGETLASTETSQATTGAASTVTVNWGAVTGATGYKVYGRTTGAELLIATLGNVLTYTDTGSVTPSGALPAANTTIDIPVWTVPIKAGTGYARSWPFGKSFATGIAYATTKLQADSDTTVLVAGDVTGSIDWI